MLSNEKDRRTQEKLKYLLPPHIKIRHGRLLVDMKDQGDVPDACIVDLQLVIGSKCCYEKNRCADAIVEAISLWTSFHPAYHFAFPLYVYANLSIFVPMPSPSLQMLCLSHTSLSLSVSPLVSSLSLLFLHT